MRWSRRTSEAAASADAGAERPEEGPTGEALEADSSANLRSQGPWDVSEMPVEEEDETRAHLGSLSVKGRPDVEIRLQVDEGSDQVAAVLLVTEDGAMELRPFAAPRHEDIWDEVRGEIAEEAKRRGGDTREIDGPYGPALQMVVPAVTPDGKQAAQQSTVLGISGPRWLLRASIFGRPAQQYDPQGALESVLRDVVVIRGGQPMTPGEPLPLSLPAGAQRIQGP